MGSWSRITPLGALPCDEVRETWTYRSAPDGPERRFDMAIKLGKPFDVIGMKGTDLSEVRDYAAFLSRIAAKLYGAETGNRHLGVCPCCGESADAAVESFRIFGVPYHRCGSCGHGFVREQPADDVQNRVFAESEEHAAAYTDAAAAEARIAQIVAPKADWSVSVYQAHHGRAPRTAIDLGAGGGHFVEGLRRTGVATAGYELSAASRRFAREAFGLELREESFLEATPEPADLMTLWGLLEYTSEPRRFLDAARRWLRPETGLLIVEVPRLDCLGTAAQTCNPDTVARHMDPTSHVNTFTDESLATALVETGFVPVAAWYFGMDAYELLIQTALRLDDNTSLAALADMIPALQASLDQGRQCDDLVIAALPQS